MCTGKFGISSRLQQLICLLVQNCVFDELEELMHGLLGVDICVRQIQQVSEYYGGQVE